MSRVFISYRREDAPDHVTELRKRLERVFSKSSVFVDVADILPGQDFHQVIVKAIKGCDVVLVVIGPKWLALQRQKAEAEGEPDYVVAELRTSRKHAASIVPVTVDGARFPQAAELPKSIRWLARRSGVALRNGQWTEDLVPLVRYLKAAELVVSKDRGYTPGRLLFSAAFWGAVGAGAAGVFGHADHKLMSCVRFAGAGAVAGLIMGAAHWYVLRGTLIVIKRHLWRWWSVALAFVISAGVATATPDHKELPAPSDFGVLVFATFVFGVYGAWRLRRADRNIRRRVAMWFWMAWLVALGAGAVASFALGEWLGIE